MQTRRFRAFGLGGKLLLLSLALLAVPWFLFRQIIDIEDLLIQGQSRAQLLTAEGISTLLHGRDDLFRLLPTQPEDYQRLYVVPLAQTVQLDGDERDWQNLTARAVSFGESNADGSPRDGTFTLLLGERAGFVYGLARVKDENLLYRSARQLRLDVADHWRLSFRDRSDVDRRFVLALADAGPITAFATDENWRFAVGDPEYRLQAVSRLAGDQAVLEFRFPLSWLPDEPRLGLAYADVDDSHQRAIVRITETLPWDDEGGFNLVTVRSPQVVSVIEGLVYAGARILVIDGERQIRAEVGSYQNAVVTTPHSPTSVAIDRFLAPLMPYTRRIMNWLPFDYHLHATSSPVRAENVITSALEGTPQSLRRELPDGKEIIMAAHPIVSGEQVLGAVVVEQNIDGILAIQRQTLERIFAVTLLSLLLVGAGFSAFSIRLAWRIRQLRQETTNAIDNEGRLTQTSLKAQTESSDEIGDLARSVSNMLSKLHQHTRFLETIPRTLRHELNNPLNTLSTSLQNLEQEHPSVRASRYLDSAKRGLMRIGGIVQHLSDAASLEEALKSDERERLDLAELLRNYVSNCHIVHSDCQFVLNGADVPAMALVADFRIEQMLDKLIDNAVDFHRAGTPIVIDVDVLRDIIQIRIANTGPTIAPELMDSLFDSLVSRRAAGHEGIHFGLGLFVVRVIASHHGGSVSAENLPDGSGVAFVVRLPRANPPRSRLRGLVGSLGGSSLTRS